MKKKIFNIFIALVFSIPCIFIFTGCNHNHQLTKIASKPATCEDAGNSEYYICDCGKYFSDADATEELEENEWVIDALGHNLTKVEAEAATCEDAGNIEYYSCDCGKYFSDAGATEELEESEIEIEALGHNLTKVEAEAATCEEAGNIEYYSCDCGKYFRDVDATEELEESEIEIEALGHDLTKVEAEAATCEADGNIEHYKCPCGKYFSDAGTTEELDANEVIIVALGHDLTKTNAEAATCEDPGNIEYYTCDCGKYFSDADATEELEENEWVINALGHDLTKVEAEAATCEDTGNIEYYTCNCGKYFSDADAIEEIEENEWVIDALGHDLTKTNAKAATCEDSGNIEYYTCNCGKYFSDADAIEEIEENEWVIAMLGHDYHASEWHDPSHQYVKKQVCANDSTHIIETDYVNVDANNINNLLNPSNIANRNWESYKFNLAAGNYDNLILDTANKTNIGTGIASSPFVFKREINTLEFVGEDRDSTIMNGFSFSQGQHVIYLSDNIVYVDGQNSYYYIYKAYEIDTLVFKNITFTGKVFVNSLLNATYYEDASIKINNIVFENVKFDMTDVAFSNAPIHIKSYNCGISNIIIKNCEFLNCAGKTANAIAIDATKTDDINISIEGCKFENIGYNAIQIAGSGNNYVGTIEIKNNLIQNTGSRAIRVGVLGGEGKLIIENNIMINASDSNGELLKCRVNETATVVINNNYWGAIDGEVAFEGLINDSNGGENILDSAPKTSI